MEFQDWKFDKRVLTRNIRKGLVTRDQFQRYLEGLPDREDNSMSLVEESDREEEGQEPTSLPSDQEESLDSEPSIE